jgi:hypothetical protein
MTVSFQVEKWSDALPELRPLIPMLWDDVAIDKGRFVAKCAEETYATLEKGGVLHLVTARDDGKLVGYYVLFITPNIHYADSGLMAFTDSYYLLPEFRRGYTGISLFKFMEETLRAKGVVKAFTSHKIHRDRSRMFKFLGWQASDVVYSKILG